MDLRSRRLSAAAALLTLTAFLLLSPSACLGTGQADQSATARVRAAALKFPLSFVPNQGQADPSVRFTARARGHRFFVTSEGAVISLRPGRGLPPGAIRMSLAGADTQAKGEGLDRLPGRVSYFLGPDPSGWRAGLPTFGRARMGEVWPGVDLVYYGREGRLEFDFVVRPGVSPGVIRLAFRGQEGLALNGRGDLVLKTRGGDVVLEAPVCYQESAGGRRDLAGRFVLLAANEVGFEVQGRDLNRTLIIDPVLTWATYLGGASDEYGKGIAVDSSGAIYVTGYTQSDGFPGTAGSAIQAARAGGYDAFATKINAGGTAIVYSTYLGGAGGERGYSIAVDSSGAAYLAGSTESDGFPGTAGSAIQAARAGNIDVFATKINAAGTAITWSTYLGGTSGEYAYGIAVDSSGAAYLTGYTGSDGFPGTAGSAIQAARAGNNDAFATKINAAGTAITWSTYLGGAGYDQGNGIALDSTGAAYLTGSTESDGFPGTAGSAIQAARAGGYDAFATKINAAGDAITWSTYLGGTSNDYGRGIAVDSSGAAYLTGYTGSDGFPGTAGSAIQAARGGSGDAFVTKINAGGTAIVYSTYLGGAANDDGYGIAVDSSGAAYLTGPTQSDGFPGTAGSAIQAARGGGNDAFATEINAGGTAIVYSTYLGGAGSDYGNGIAVDSTGAACVTGYTASNGFPGTAGSAIQAARVGSTEAFVAKIGLSSSSGGADDSFESTGGTTDRFGVPPLVNGRAPRVVGPGGGLPNPLSPGQARSFRISLPFSVGQDSTGVAGELRPADSSIPGLILGWTRPGGDQNRWWLPLEATGSLANGIAWTTSLKNYYGRSTLELDYTLPADFLTGLGAGRHTVSYWLMDQERNCSNLRREFFQVGGEASLTGQPALAGLASSLTLKVMILTYSSSDCRLRKLETGQCLINSGRGAVNQEAIDEGMLEVSLPTSVTSRIVITSPDCPTVTLRAEFRSGFLYLYDEGDNDRAVTYYLNPDGSYALEYYRNRVHITNQGDCLGPVLGLIYHRD